MLARSLLLALGLTVINIIPRSDAQRRFVLGSVLALGLMTETRQHCRVGGDLTKNPWALVSRGGAGAVAS